MSRAWMPFYVGDYLRDTMHLSTFEHGMYIRLIVHYWVHGCLPTSKAGLARVAGVPKQTFADHESTLAGFFSHPGWRHKRIDDELEKHEKVRSARKISGSIGGTRAQVNRLLRQANGQANALSRKRANALALAQANALPTIKKESKKEAAEEESEPRKGDKPSIPISPALLASVQRWKP